MRAGFFGGTRGNYFDRTPTQNPLSVSLSNVAPTPDTVRATYTVPAARKALVSSLFVSFVRITSATTPAEVHHRVLFTPSGGGGKITLEVVLQTNNVGDRASEALSPQAVLLAGDLIEFHTFDLSTGGTVSYSGGALITEFAA